MNEKETLAAAAAVFEHVDGVHEIASDTLIDQHFAKLRSEAEAEITIKGIRPQKADAMLDEVEEEHRRRYDKLIAGGAAAALQELRALELELEAQAERAKVLQPSRYATPSDNLLARSANVLERQELRAQAAAMTLDQLATLYEQLTDQDDPGVVAFIETELIAGWPTLHTRPDDEDAAKAIDRLNGLVAARREQRIPLHVREVRALLEARVPTAKRLWLKELSRTKDGEPLRTPAMTRFKKLDRVETIDGRTPERIALEGAVRRKR